jgi:hypothetical protein
MQTDANDIKQTTPKLVAEWMVAQLEAKDELPQQATAQQIQERFGSEFVCLDA